MVHEVIFKQQVMKFRRKIFLLLFLRYFAIVIPFLLFIWGAVLLTVKALSYSNEFSMVSIWIVSALAGLLALVSIVIAIKKLPDPVKLLAVMDNNSQGGGLITASSELDISQWQSKCPQIFLPALSWRYQKPAFVFFMAAVFALFAFIVPARSLAVRPPAIDISPEITQLNEKLEVLSQENAIEDDLFKQFEKDIANMDQRAENGRSAGLWEAMDHLQNSLNRLAQTKTAEMTKQMNSSALAESLAQAINQSADSVSADLMTPALEKLAELAAQALTPQAAEKLGLSPEELKKMLEELKQSCDASQLAQLQSKLSQCKGNMSQSVSNMAKMKLIDAELLKMCEGAGKCDSKKLAEYLAKCQGNLAKFSECSGLCAGGIPGRGGISRGRGDAEMSWTDPSSTENINFREEILPPGEFANLKDSQVQGISIGDPGDEQAIVDNATGALSGAAASGGTAVGGQILPGHKKIIKNYFQTE